MIGVSALCVMDCFDFSLQKLTVYKRNVRTQFRKQTWRIQHVLDVRLYRGSKNIDRLLTSPVENMDQYNGSQKFSTVYSPGLMVSNLPDNALEIHGIAYNNPFLPPPGLLSPPDPCHQSIKVLFKKYNAFKFSLAVEPLK